MKRADAVVERLLSTVPRTAASVAAPGPQGFYAWWCDDAGLGQTTPPIPPVRPPGAADTWFLLYVGIGPVRDGSRTLTDRLVTDHQRGSIGGSTFRLSLASLLVDQLALRLVPGSDRPRLGNEPTLSRWMTEHLGLTVAPCDRPWEIEAEVIGRLSPPLNIQGGTHPFRAEVQRARADLRRRCAYR